MLREGELEVIGRLTDATNATFLCRVTPAVGDDLDAWPEDQAADAGSDATNVRCVYKPRRGERPLDDFPAGTLARRELAAYLLSQASGWDIVPPTVLRDGPFGDGMVQAWVEPDPEIDVLELVMSGDERLRAICLFDVIANNADRKGSHILPLATRDLLGVDHGICFAVEPKLRTVLWAWRGESLNSDEMATVRRVRDALEGALGAGLAGLLTADEIRATTERADALLQHGRFPLPSPTRPAVPWPPF